MVGFIINWVKFLIKVFYSLQKLGVRHVARGICSDASYMVNM